MRAAALAALPAFNLRFEGRCAWMYLDTHKPDPLVTTGIGNLIDPIGAALALPWLAPDGNPASEDAIAAEWSYVKSRVDLAAEGGGVFAQHTSLRLSSDTIDALERDQVARNEAELRRHFPGFDSFPCDAQLGIHSMAYAMGAGFPATYPHFTAAANRGDWVTAAAQCAMAGANPPVLRNLANKLCFLNATKGNPAKLYWPGTSAAGGFSGLAVLALLGVGYGAWRLIRFHHALSGL